MAERCLVTDRGHIGPGGPMGVVRCILEGGHAGDHRWITDDEADQRREEAWRREKEGNVLTKSDQIELLATALSKAQGAFKPVEKDKKNPYFGSRFASLDAIMEMARPVLAANGLALTQLPRQPHLNEERDGIEMVLETLLMHTSGQWVKSVYPLRPDLRDAEGDGGKVKRANVDQRVGSSITYARRYAAAAILGIVADEDDDAESSGPPRNGARRGPAPESMEEAKAKLRAADPNAVLEAQAMANAFVVELKAPGVDLAAWKQTNAKAMAAIREVDEGAWQRVVDAGIAAGRGR